MTGTLITTITLVGLFLIIFIYQHYQETMTSWAPWPSYELCDKPIAYQFP